MSNAIRDFDTHKQCSSRATVSARGCECRDNNVNMEFPEKDGKAALDSAHGDASMAVTMLACFFPLCFGCCFLLDCLEHIHRFDVLFTIVEHELIFEHLVIDIVLGCRQVRLPLFGELVYPSWDLYCLRTA